MAPFPEKSRGEGYDNLFLSEEAKKCIFSKTSLELFLIFFNENKKQLIFQNIEWGYCLSLQFGTYLR